MLNTYIEAHIHNIKAHKSYIKVHDEAYTCNLLQIKCIAFSFSSAYVLKGGKPLFFELMFDAETEILNDYYSTSLSTTVCQDPPKAPVSDSTD